MPAVNRALPNGRATAPPAAIGVICGLNVLALNRLFDVNLSDADGEFQKRSSGAGTRPD